MSAKPCNRCGGVIVFGTDKETGRVLPLSVGSEVYKVVKENIVMRDPKALIRHVCQTKPPELELPPTDRDFTEPKSQE